VKKTTVFEGWYDQEPGWEFDMPCYMNRPILGYCEPGSGPAGVDELVEEYLISRFARLENGRAIGTDDDFFLQMDDDAVHSSRVQFALAKKGKAREGVFYWRQVVEWDDEDESYTNVLEDVDYGRGGLRRGQ
jgi:hypothetical protein